MSGALLDIVPGPDGAPFTIVVECRTSPGARKGALHEVTIEPDWAVSTPHDIEAERVAAAFGGYASCLILVDETIPAFRESLALLTRRIRPELRRDAGGGWRFSREDQVKGCCQATRFRTVEKAVRHLRSQPHLIKAHGVPAWQFEQVMDGAQRAWGPWEGMRELFHNHLEEGVTPMTASPSIDSEDGRGVPGVGLTQVSTGVCDCLGMGFVGPIPRGCHPRDRTRGVTS